MGTYLNPGSCGFQRILNSEYVDKTDNLVYVSRPRCFGKSFAFSHYLGSEAEEWEGFVRGLRKINYQGNLCFETGPVLSSFPKVMKQDVLGFISKIGRYFSEEIASNLYK